MGRILKTLSLTAGVAMLGMAGHGERQAHRTGKRRQSVGFADAELRQHPLLHARSDQQGNVKDLQVAWTFSTGVLRGHEGGPLVIGDMMYVHTPFPNIVYALDLNTDGAIKWKYEPSQDPNVIPVMCCDTVNRGVAYAPADGKPHHPASGRYDGRRAGRRDRRGSLEGEDRRRSEQGRKRAPTPRWSSRTRSSVGMSGGEFGVQGYVVAYNLKDGRGLARLFDGPGCTTR